MFELRHAEAGQPSRARQPSRGHEGRDLKLEHSEDVRVSTLRQYLEALGACLELVAVFDEEHRRVPIHLGIADPAG